jgi:hypothetical protein
MIRNVEGSQELVRLGSPELDSVVFISTGQESAIK